MSVGCIPLVDTAIHGFLFNPWMEDIHGWNATVTQSFPIARVTVYQLGQRTLAQCPHRSDARSQWANGSD